VVSSIYGFFACSEGDVSVCPADDGCLGDCWRGSACAGRGREGTRTPPMAIAEISSLVAARVLTQTFCRVPKRSAFNKRNIVIGIIIICYYYASIVLKVVYESAIAESVLENVRIRICGDDEVEWFSEAFWVCIWDLLVMRWG